MSLIVVDVEADGACPGLFSMVCFGAVEVKKGLKNTFYGETEPISRKWNIGALEVSGFTRKEHEKFPNPSLAMDGFAKWLKNTEGNPVFISDNPAFDWQWINYYFHYYHGHNPFGFSARRIGDIYAGLTKNARNSSKWKKFRKTKHTHHPVDDAMGNAQALLKIQELGVKNICR